jgi:hypothetical protein
MGRRPDIDPYDAMMNRLERNGWAYALASGAALVACFVTWNSNNEGASQFGPLVEQVRSMIGLGFLCLCGLSCALSLWSMGRYVYFAKWPERFTYP